MIFTFQDVEFEFDDSDREYSIFYRECLKAGNDAICRFENDFYIISKTINENNRKQLIYNLVGDYCDILGSLFSVVWKYCLQKKKYTVVKEDLNMQINAKLLVALQQNIDHFVIGDEVVHFLLKQEFNVYFVSGWLRSVADKDDGIKKLCNSIRENLYYFVLGDMSDVLNEHNILQNKYNFVIYRNIFLNIWSDGLRWDNLKEWIENIKNFPFDICAYQRVIQLCGDEKNEIQNIGDYLEFGQELTIFKKKLLTNYLEDIETFNQDISKLSEEELIQNKKAIEAKMHYLGFIGEVDFLTKIEERLHQIDILERTVNGKLYSSRELAISVRNRSFDGKEYNSEEEMELVKEEVLEIRTKINSDHLIEKHKLYIELMRKDWHTQEAVDELKDIKIKLNEDYNKIQKKASSLMLWNKRIKIGLVISLILFFVSFSLSSKIVRGIIWGIIFWVMLEIYLNFRESVSAQKELVDLDNYRNSDDWNQTIN